MSFLLNSQIQIIIQLLLAVILGTLVGFEREFQKRAAGLKTHSLVCLGATLFTIVSLEVFKLFSDKSGVSFDPSKVISSIVMGVGFIGAGLIIYRRFKVEGLTTAAGIWVVAAIGVAIGIKMYLEAIFTTFLTLGVLTLFKVIEEKILKIKEK
jgi:putative Mg2+ transporter-C (MgtC) family protein